MPVGYAFGTITGAAPVFGTEIANVRTVLYLPGLEASMQLYCRWDIAGSSRSLSSGSDAPFAEDTLRMNYQHSYIHHTILT